MRLHTLILLPALLAGGCASLSESECRDANWEDIGYRDGADGARRERAADHAEACREYGISIDEKAWKRGYEGGLQTYCTPQNAVQVGLSGGSYAGVCPPESDREFATHWRAARPVFEQRQRVNQLESRRRELEYAYSSADNDQQRYNVRVELARLDEQLRHERQRLYYEEDRLNQFLRGIQ